jgi:hypothetical protein
MNNILKILLVLNTILLINFNGFSQFTTGQKYSGDGVYLSCTQSGIIVKWSNTANEVITKKAVYDDQTMYNYRYAVLWDIEGSSNYFLQQDCVWGGCVEFMYFNELGKLIWSVYLNRE